VGGDQDVLMSTPLRHADAVELHEPHNRDIDFRQFLLSLWQGRWIIAAVTIAITLAGAIYAFAAPVWFTAEVTLAQAQKRSLGSSLGQLGGLASLAGINLSAPEGAEPISVLKSKGLIRDFISEENLLPILLEDKWDSAKGGWKAAGKDAPDIRDGVKYFDESVRSVVEDKKSGLVTLSIRWHDAEVAARWANALYQRVNARLRAQTIRESQTSIDYLQKEMQQTTVISLQQSIGRVLEGQMQSMALARSNEEYAFKVIDPAVAPKYRSEPKRLLILVASFMIGLVLGVTGLGIRNSFIESKIHS
jgi:uncharacterized protein involved in exopolysaccharide biosynthesis